MLLLVSKLAGREKVTIIWLDIKDRWVVYASKKSSWHEISEHTTKKRIQERVRTGFEWLNSVCVEETREKKESNRAELSDLH